METEYNSATLKDYPVECPGDVQIGDEIVCQEYVYHEFSVPAGDRTIYAKVILKALGCSTDIPTLTLKLHKSEGFDPLLPNTEIIREGRSLLLKRRKKWEDEDLRLKEEKEFTDFLNAGVFTIKKVWHKKDKNGQQGFARQETVRGLDAVEKTVIRLGTEEDGIYFLDSESLERIEGNYPKFNREFYKGPGLYQCKGTMPETDIFRFASLAADITLKWLVRINGHELIELQSFNLVIEKLEQSKS